MKKHNVWLFSLLFCIISITAAVAQPTNDDPEKSPTDPRVEDIHALNEKVNSQISEKVLFSHRISLNADRKVYEGAGEYSESINCFYEMNGKKPVLKKFVVMTSKDGIKSYIDMLYDEQGLLQYCYFQPDISNPELGSESYYFSQGAMIACVDDGELVIETKLTDKHRQSTSMSGILTRAGDYAYLFSAFAKLTFGN